jgi:hypothetical protein|tara:strand:- start:2162 stop:2839 length:678 start_codon:yes stop_codon:yes gene_type:complete
VKNPLTKKNNGIHESSQSPDRSPPAPTLHPPPAKSESPQTTTPRAAPSPKASPHPADRLKNDIFPFPCSFFILIGPTRKKRTPFFSQKTCSVFARDIDLSTNPAPLIVSSSDHQLLKQHQRHPSGGALATLIDRHLPLVLSVARRITANDEAARDISQTVFLRLLKKASNIPATLPLTAWFHHLVAGKQKFPQALNQLPYGPSITDQGIDWKATEGLILNAPNTL